MAVSWKSRLAFLWVLFLFLCLPETLWARALQLQSLDYANPRLRHLRREIALNLRSVARGRGLERPLRVVRYTVRKNDNFFSIMARVSQDLDTLVSLNDLPNPNALRTGQILLIPNARGRFIRKKEELPLAFRKSKSLPRIAGAYFLAGERMPIAERRYFRGEGFLPPLRSRQAHLSSGFGSRRDPFRNVLTFHGGIDLAAATGTPVHASRSGVVIRAETRVQGYGSLVVIRHRFGYTSWYGHLSKILVQKGAKIRRGQKIGLVGATGRATGPHLHFEIRKNGRKQNPGILLHQARH